MGGSGVIVSTAASTLTGPAGGVTSIVGGTTTVVDGETTVVGGATTVIGGATTVIGGATTVIGGTATVVDGVSSLISGGGTASTTGVAAIAVSTDLVAQTATDLAALPTNAAALSTVAAIVSDSAALSTDLQTSGVVTGSNAFFSTIVAPVTSDMTTVLLSTEANGNVDTLTSVETIVGHTTYVEVEYSTTVAANAPEASSLNSAAGISSTGFFSNSGAVVGTFLAVGLAALASIVGGFFFARRRKRQRALDEDLRMAAGGAGDGGAGTSRFQDDDDEEDDLAGPLNAHGGYKQQPMQQHNPFALPAGAASSLLPYADDPSTSQSGSQNRSSYTASSGFHGAGGGAVASTSAAAGYGAYSSYARTTAPSYHTNQAYPDHYGGGRDYAGGSRGGYSDQPDLYNSTHGSRQTRYEEDELDGSGGSRESDVRRDSTWVFSSSS